MPSSGPPSWPACRSASPAGRSAAGQAAERQSAEEVSSQLNAQTAEQLFAVLGQLKGGAMKFGQALSVFEAALPEELAAPYREALTKLQEAAPPMPAAHRAPGAGRAARRRAGASGSASSTTSRRPRPASARCTARSGATAARSPSRSSTRAPDRRCCPTSTSSPLRPAVRRRWSPALESSRCSPSCASAWSRSWTTGLEADVAARVRRGLRRRRARSLVAPGRGQRAEGDRHRVDRRARRCRAIIARRHARASATTPARCSPLLHFSGAGSGPGCCTPTRIRATSGCCPTAGSASSTSARSPGCPTACPGPLGRLTRLVAGATGPTNCSRPAATRGSCAPGSRGRRRRR